MKIMKCSCGSEPTLDADYVGWLIHCSNCYDADCVGDPPQMVSDSITGWGHTKEEATEDWNEKQMEAL